MTERAAPAFRESSTIELDMISYALLSCANLGIVKEDLGLLSCPFQRVLSRVKIWVFKDSSEDNPSSKLIRVVNESRESESQNLRGG